MKQSIDNELKIIRKELVLKEDSSEDKDKVIKAWLKISTLTERIDRKYFNIQPHDKYAKEFLFLDVVSKGGAVFLIFQIFNDLKNTSPHVRVDIPGLVDEQLLSSVTQASVAFTFLVLSTIIIFIAFKGVSSLKHFILEKDALSSVHRLQSLSIDDTIQHFISQYAKDNMALVLDNIDFDKTLNNFRKMQSTPNIGVFLAKMNNQDAAVIKILNK